MSPSVMAPDEAGESGAPGPWAEDLLFSTPSGFPLVERPFSALAGPCGLSEDGMIDHLQALLADGTLLRFGPVFDVVRVGGCSVTAALRVPEPRIGHLAAEVQAMPEVAEMALRAHPLNVWLCIEAESAADVDAALARIGQIAAAACVRLTDSRSAGGRAAGAATGLDAFDRRLVVAVQGGLPLLARPYEAIAAMLGSDGDTIRARLSAWLESGFVRRFGAVRAPPAASEATKVLKSTGFRLPEP